MRETITIPLTRDQWSTILEALEDYNHRKLDLYQLDDYDTGTDKEDYVSDLEDKIRERV